MAKPKLQFDSSMGIGVTASRKSADRKYVETGFFPALAHRAQRALFVRQAFSSWKLSQPGEHFSRFPGANKVTACMFDNSDRDALNLVGHKSAYSLPCISLGGAPMM